MSKRIDITGERFGRLVAIREIGRSASNSVIWQLKCDCGNTAQAATRNLRYGEPRSCGCLVNTSKAQAAAVAAKRRRAEDRAERVHAAGVKECSNSSCRMSNPQPISEFGRDGRKPIGLQSRCRTCSADGVFFVKYGISRLDKQRILKQQGGTCANRRCGIILSERSGHLDHCHDTGVIRGVLCGGCNNSLGHMKDSPDRIRGLMEYAVRNSQLSAPSEKRA